jgi:hypothetical protein
MEAWPWAQAQPDPGAVSIPRRSAPWRPGASRTLRPVGQEGATRLDAPRSAKARPSGGGAGVWGTGPLVQVLRLATRRSLNRECWLAGRAPSCPGIRSPRSSWVASATRPACVPVATYLTDVTVQPRWIQPLAPTCASRQPHLGRDADRATGQGSPVVREPDPATSTITAAD